MSPEEQPTNLGNLLEPSSEIGTLYELYLSHTHKQMLEARRKEIKGPLLPIVDPNIVCAKELVRTGKTTCPQYANAGTTPKAMETIRKENQRSSPLLKLPTEMLIMIWKSAFESTQTKRVHGAVSRSASGHGLLSLVHTCSLLHSVLYPVFLSQDAFVVKVSSSDPSIAAKEVIEWWTKVSSILTLGEPIKPLIFLTLQTGYLPFEEAVHLAVKVQIVCSSTPLFEPKVLVETNEWLCYYCGPGALMRLHAPHMGDSWGEQFRNGWCFTTSDAAPLCHDDMWMGWVAVPIHQHSFVFTQRVSSAGTPTSWDRWWGRHNKEREMLAFCGSYENA